MATNATSDKIVPFLLEPDKYEHWTIFLKNYLLAQDLWNLTEKGDALPSSDEAEPRKKNAAALHAIHITCSPDVFALIKDISSAKEAWEKLAEMHQQWQSDSQPKLESSSDIPSTSSHVPSSDVPSISSNIPSSDIPSTSSNIPSSDVPSASSNIPPSDIPSTSSVSLSRTERPTACQLEWEINKGDWKTAHEILQEYPHLINGIINDSGETALHVAVYSNAVEIAQELIQRMSETDLEKKDMYGNTALSFVARNGKRIAECLVEKNKKLLTIPDQEGYIPIVWACASGGRNLTKYLYSETPKELLSPDGGKSGVRLLSLTIIGKMFDISLDLLRDYPSLAVTHDDLGTPILRLSSETSAFFSGTGLGFWQRLIYHCIKINKHSSSNDVPIAVAHQDQNSVSNDVSASNDVLIPVTHQDQKEEKNIKMKAFFGLRGLDLMLLKFSGIKQIYDSKLTHARSLEVLKCMCKHIKSLNPKESAAGHVSQALFQATKNGLEEFVVEMVKAKPHTFHSFDEHKRTIFMCAVEYRQEKIFSFFCSLDAWKYRFYHTDNQGNNCLHIAGMLAPDSRLARISGAALQMQRELQWFKEVQSVVPEWCKNARNKHGETPGDVFTKSHKELAKQGEEWMKATASSSSVVGSLIITIMFAAIFTVPGGNNQETGFPILLGEKSFMVFLISDAISLFTASISVLMFLGILTSRYAEEDFYKSLPHKLILGLSTLFISITTMMVTFSAALIIILQERWSVILPIILLAALPVTLFMRLQFPLLVENFISTYRPGIIKTTKLRP